MNKKLTGDRLTKTYFCIFAVSAVLFFVMLAVTDGQSFTHTLFRNSFSTDIFMDFFNSIRDASTKEVYEEGIIYPPLANMFFYLLSLLIDPELAATSFSYRTMLQRDYVCLFLYFVFVILCFLLFSSTVKKQLAENNLNKFSAVFPVLLIFSYPMIYCVQRGNIALLSLVFSMFFVFNRNSEKPFLKELSFILLAVAAGIKLYPAVFGLLLITDKKYKEAARLVAYGLICIILPFFFYDGIESIKDLFQNLNSFSAYSTNKLSPEFVCIDVPALYISALTKIDFSDIYTFLGTIVTSSAILIFIFADKEWQKLWAMVYLIMNYPSTARTYILIFALIPFISFICSKSFRKRDLPYFVAFILLIVVIPPVYYSKAGVMSEYLLSVFDPHVLGFNLNKYIASPNQLLSSFIVSGMTLYMVIDLLVSVGRGEIKLRIFKKIKRFKKNKV